MGVGGVGSGSPLSRREDSHSIIEPKCLVSFAIESVYSPISFTASHLGRLIDLYAVFSVRVISAPRKCSSFNYF